MPVGAPIWPRAGYTSISAAALEVRPRPAFERSGTPKEQPLTYFSFQQYETDFPSFPHAIGAPTSTLRDKGKGKLSDCSSLHITGTSKGKGKLTVKTLRKDPRKASIKAPRKNQSKTLAKGQARAKGKGKEKSYK